MRSALLILILLVRPSLADGPVGGRVVWDGPVPPAEPIRGERLRPMALGTDPFERPNPHAPAIGPDGGIANAIIELRPASPQPPRPWPHPPVSIAVSDGWPMVQQGGLQLVGFVRAGDTISITSRHVGTYHALRARGAAFFTVALPDADKPRARKLTQPGWVELSSAAGFPAMRGYLVVSDHPYLTRTDAAGRFEWPSVPAGAYTLTAKFPDWRIERTERDPEMGVPVRTVYRPMFEQSVAVTAGPAVAVELRFRAGQ